MSDTGTERGRALPSYRELPVVEGGVHSGWGVFGEDDAVGLMNLLSPEAVLRAARSLRTGRVFPLDISSELLTPPLFSRGASRLTPLVSRQDKILDDVRDNVYSQAGSQWDSLGHVAYTPDAFYNGATADDVLSGRRNTIDHWARRGIAGRGVVLDVSDVVASRGGPGESVPVTVGDLEAARERAGIEYEPGDILLVHTGFLRWYTAQPAGVRTRLSRRDTLTAAGIEHSEEIVEYLWNSHVSAIASDTAAVEVWPPDEREESWPFGFMHQILIGQLGLALGELWWLSDLVEDCRADGRYECLIVSAPQNVPGAIGSPANVVALR
ncbi:cyclase family protein [Compostimonas suwonensis]|uniref:Putative cyclase n=1 Tax=Compostimonas suwonensis TaxID=1048394 RepID=A0A2M9BZE2_9MICO|nr:cyclase family protein [Compostimonas suwonensis]PJJ63457.1 putative cyclase [Compostimonas suwonensis]